MTPGRPDKGEADPPSALSAEISQEETEIPEPLSQTSMGPWLFNRL